jgi:8-oxo-dGTP pyrophosphatase MutT (NUDIX family)
VDENEPLEHGAARELQEETSVDPSSVALRQVSHQHMCNIAFESKVRLRSCASKLFPSTTTPLLMCWPLRSAPSEIQKGIPVAGQ